MADSPNPKTFLETVSRLRPSLAKDEPLADSETKGIAIECASLAGYDQIFFCVSWDGSGGSVQRLERRLNRDSKSAKIVNDSLWEGKVQSKESFVDSLLNGLSSKGIWETEDFSPTEELLDGEMYVIRIKTSKNVKTVVWFSPSYSKDTRILSIVKEVEELMYLPRRKMKQKASSWFL